MNPVILFFLNVFLTCIECIALYLFSSCFFSCRCHSIKLIISLCLLAITNIAAYAVTQGSLIAKLVAITIVDMIWINLSFQASAVKSLIAALFYCSFLTLGDGALLMGIAVITKQDIHSAFRLKHGLNDQQCDKMRDCNRKGKAEPPHFLCTNLFPVDKQC